MTASSPSSGGRPIEAFARILIVDDEVAHVQALCNILRAHGYATLGCTSAAQALAALQTERFEILVTDLLMPDMDGIALLRAAHQLDSDLMGVIMTGQGSIESAVDAMKSGASDYVLKPLRLNDLTSVLARALTTRRLRIENRDLLQKLSERTLELEAANGELEAFTYSVSHDLRAPLRAVAGFSELLVLEFADQLPIEAQELTQRILAGAKRMDTLIDDLLRLSQVSRQPLEQSDVDMRKLTLEVIEQLQRMGHGKAASIEVGPLPRARGDLGLVGHALTNLIYNAFKFTRDNPAAAVTVNFELVDGQVVYFVRDNGVGFDMRQAGRLFGAFQRLHSANSFEGNGVGLSIVQRIVVRHGGRLWAHAEVGKGATFSFTLSS